MSCVLLIYVHPIGTKSNLHNFHQKSTECFVRSKHMGKVICMVITKYTYSQNADEALLISLVSSTQPT